MTRRWLPLALCSILGGCGLIVGPGSKYLADGAVDGPDADVDAGPGMDGGEIDDGGERPDVPTDPLPPVGSGVGLSDYRPVVGQTLRVTVGPYLDPNGDDVSVSYQWLDESGPIAGATSDSLELTQPPFGADGEISVRVTLDDGELQTVLEAGPARIEPPDLTAWELLAPPRSGIVGGAMGFFDARRQRLIYHAVNQDRSFGFWEMQLGGDEQRWVRLANVNDPGPSEFRTPIPDP
ncbi:MAG TPA: hypothetical protein RMH99_01750, partial [Sandaracinaceae bacterium LLY-WYZ-13_1]|nr:hypothetical protein [Sandaracinaceae bacterium LLY-WYZ-13_1]